MLSASRTMVSTSEQMCVSTALAMFHGFNIQWLSNDLANRCTPMWNDKKYNSIPVGYVPLAHRTQAATRCEHQWRPVKWGHQVNKFGQISSLGYQMSLAGSGVRALHSGGGVGFRGGLHGEVQCITGNGHTGPHWTEWPADTCENITFPQLCWRVVITVFSFKATFASLKMRSQADKHFQTKSELKTWTLYTHSFSLCWKYETNFGSSVTRLNVVGNQLGSVSRVELYLLPMLELTTLRATTARASFTVRNISLGNWLTKQFGRFSLKDLKWNIGTLQSLKWLMTTKTLGIERL